MLQPTTTAGSIHASDDVLELSRLEERLPPLLSVVAGMVDVTGFFTLGNIFTAHITGCGDSCLHPRARRRVAARPRVRPARSGPGATISANSASVATMRRTVVPCIVSKRRR
jgi:hypothetical protein